MKIEETDLAGVKLITHPRFDDERGYFEIPFESEAFAAAGLPTEWKQINHSHSSRGVLRGLHYQLDHPQGKLIWVLQGSIYDVAVDIRRSSPNFGKSFGMVLNGNEPQMLYIPPKFAHGFYVMSETVDVLYAVSNKYDPASERSLLWNDPALDIDWPLGGGRPILSVKDTAALSLDLTPLPPERGDV